MRRELSEKAPLSTEPVLEADWLVTSNIAQSDVIVNTSRTLAGSGVGAFSLCQATPGMTTWRDIRQGYGAGVVAIESAMPVSPKIQ